MKKVRFKIMFVFSIILFFQGVLLAPTNRLLIRAAEVLSSGPAKTSSYLASINDTVNLKYNDVPSQKVRPQYVQTPSKDFNIDAPWRVQDNNTPIPFVFAIKDVFLDPLERLDNVRIYMISSGEEKLLYMHDFAGIMIDANNVNSTNGSWEWNISNFENAWNPALDGLPITESNLNSGSNDILFRAEINGYDNQSTINFKKYLKVHIGVPLPKPLLGNWYYGDTHYHSEYTDNPYEYGGTLVSTKNSAVAMGLDWVTITDHASNHLCSVLEPWWGFFGYWDLCLDSWNNRNNRVTYINYYSDKFLLIPAEEIACQPVGGVTAGQIHLLAYGNSIFIPGDVSIVNAEHSLQSRIDLMGSTAFAYAAHPLNVMLTGGILRWSSHNYNTAFSNDKFSGLEIWNERETKKTDGIIDNDINPFINNGDWESQDENWAQTLEDGIAKWDELLRNNLNPLKKIFIEGGSDAHGEFNYKTKGAQNITSCSDSALGKVRTLIYSNGGISQSAILNGLKRGTSIVTDGPVVIFGIDKNYDGELDIENDTLIGSESPKDANQSLSFLIKWYSSTEFGEISEINIYRGDLSGTQVIDTITPPSGQLDGFQIWTQSESISPGTCYYRLEAIIKENDKIRYRAYTNPIWIDATDSTYTGYLDQNSISQTHPITIKNDGSLTLKNVFNSTLSIFSVRIHDLNNTELHGPYNPTNGAIYGPYGLKAGSYLLKVTRMSGSGSYTLTTTYAAQPIPNDCEPNDSFSTACLIPENGSTPGHLGYKGGGNGTTDVVDNFKFILGADGESKLKIEYDATLTIWSVQIRDVDNTLLFSQPMPQNGVLYDGYGLKAGTYYLIITRETKETNYGGYNLTTFYTAQPIPNDCEPNDSFSTACLIPNNGSTPGHLSYKGGGNGTTDVVDNFKFILGADGESKLKIEYDATLTIWSVQIRDVDNTLLFSQPMPQNGVLYDGYGLKAGTYYLIITRETKETNYGGYNLTTFYTAQPIPNDCEPNDSCSTACLIPDNGSTSGHLGYKGGGNGTTDVVDYFKITFSPNGQLGFKVIFDSPLSIASVGIYDVNCLPLYTKVNPSSGVIYGPYNLTAGTYNIKISRNSGYGGYVLQLQLPIIPPPPITTFLIPFGALNNGNVNIGNMSGALSNITISMLNSNGSIVKQQSTTIPAKGVKRTWDLVSNIFGYGKPLTVEIIGDQLLIGDNIKWADPPYDTVGAGFTCGPLSLMKGKEFYFPFSAFGQSSGYAVVSNTTTSQANLTIEVYDQAGALKKTSAMTVGAKGVARTWETIGSIQAIADPAVLRITSDQEVVVEAVRWEQNKRGWGFAILPSATGSGTSFLVPFGSLNNGSINLANISVSAANVTLRVLNVAGQNVKEQAFTIPAKGVKRSWDLIGNVFTYGKPATVEITSDQALVGDNIKWADPPYDTVGAGFTCGPLSLMKGKEFYFPFSAFGQSNGYAVLSNTSASQATLTIEVYDQAGALKKTSAMTIGAKGVARTWETIGSIQAIADPAVLRITSDQDVVVEAVRWEQNKRGWGFAILPVL